MAFNRFEEMCVYENALRLKGFSRIAGIDEAGRGPLAGPVVAACCILPPHLNIPSLNDSKQLSPKVRKEIYEKLTQIDDVIFGIGEASVTEIDRLNILQATFLAMQRAVSFMKIPPDYLLIDGNRSPIFSIPKQTIVKGDCLSVSIAAASILAKVFRDDLMDQMDEKWPEYGFKQHKGYGTQLHLEAIEKWGPCPEHRRSFDPIRTLLNQQHTVL